METLQTNAKYIVELYPVDRSQPSSSGVFKAASQISSGKGDKKNFVEQIFAAQYEDAKDDPVVTYGINNISFGRSKNNPASECTFSLTGKLHKDLKPGTWVVISALLADKKVDTFSANFTRIIKYIGQVHTINISFQNMGNGLLTTTNTVSIREWSHVLTVPFRYDVYTIFAEAKSKTTVAGAIGALQKSGLPSNTLEVLTKSNFDPFNLAHAILTLVGMISDTDKIKSKDGEDYSKYNKLPNFSTRPPQIPELLKERLELKSSGLGSVLSSGLGINSSQSSYAQGFVKVLTGVQTKPINNIDWNGIWDSNNSLEEYQDNLKKGYTKDNPIQRTVNGANLFTQIGKSAWEMLSLYCNNTFTEIYSDLLYVNSGSKFAWKPEVRNIICQPIIMIRDKPFLMKKFKPELKYAKQGWTFYDDIPCVTINSTGIISIRFQNTCVTSPNYLRPEFDSSTANRNKINSLALSSDSIIRMVEEQNMFGGQEKFLYTFYLPDATNDQGSIEDMFNATTELGKYWYSYLYKMYSARIMLKEDGSALSVGNNLQFKIGKYNVVGHIDAFETNFTINQNGLETYTTSVSLSRIVHRTQWGELDFIPIEDISQLPFTKEEESGIVDIPDFSIIS